MQLRSIRGIRRSMLPKSCSSSEVYGYTAGPKEGVPLAGDPVDQQGAKWEPQIAHFAADQYYIPWKKAVARIFNWTEI